MKKTSISKILIILMVLSYLAFISLFFLKLPFLFGYGLHITITNFVFAISGLFFWKILKKDQKNKKLATTIALISLIPFIYLIIFFGVNLIYNYLIKNF